MDDTKLTDSINDSKEPLDPQKVIPDLRRLRQESDLTGGDQTEHGKHNRAVTAIGFAWDLFEQEVGWAIDHLAGFGLAIDGPLIRADLPGQKRDTHEHERRAWEYDSEDAALRRRVLATVFLGLPETRRSNLLLELGEALESLEVGYIEEIIKPKGKLKKRGSPKLRNCFLEAWEHIEFRVAAGMKREDALADVFSTYGVTGSSWDSWKASVRAMFGPRADERLEIARRAGRAYRESGGLTSASKDEYFGGDSLGYGGRRYKKQKKAKNLNKLSSPSNHPTH